MFKNINIKQKLSLMIIVPFVALIYFSFQNYIIVQHNLTHLKKFEKCLSYSIKIQKLIHSLQLERGMSLGYLGSNGKKYKQKLEKQIKITNTIRDEIILFVKKEKFNTCPLIKFEKIEKIREQIKINKISHEDAIKFYEHIIEKHISIVSNLATLSSDFTLAKGSLSLIHLIKAQEYLGLERALLTQIFTNKKFSAKEYIQLKYYSNNYDTELKIFKKIARSKVINYYNKINNKINNTKIEKIQSLIHNKIYKNELISQIQAIAGYGGLIHDFKNYLLRGDKFYKIRFFKNYNQLIFLFNQYKKYDTTPEELVYINDIINVFEQYNKNLIKMDKVRYLKSNKKIDDLISIDDKKAIEALRILSSNILGVDANIWFSLMTRKIDDLYKVEKMLYQELIEIKTKKIDELTHGLRDKLIIIFIIMLSVLFISFKIVDGFLLKIEKLENGLLSFLNYITQKETKFQLLKVTGKDEIDIIAEVLNKSMLSTSKHIEDKIKIAAQREKKIQESVKMVQMGEMIGNIAHQWRQPLSVISTLASGLIVSKELSILDDKTFYKQCNQIVDNTNYLSETINTFRDFVKEDKELKLVVIQDRIKASLNIVGATLKDMHIELIDNVDYENKIQSKIIIGELSQVIINIINNAKDILLEKKIEKSWVKIECTSTNELITITIEDNGGGIPQDVLPKIFEPYFTTKHQSQGTGLGLHMSHDIITKSLKGKLYAKNTSNGAKFYIEIPVIK